METNKPAKIQVNADYFKNVDNEQKAYWLGYIYADGYAAKKAPWAVIIQTKDADHLQKFADDIEYTGTIKMTNGSGYKEDSKHGRLAVCRKQMCEDLIHIGRYNSPMTIPSIDESLVPHFIRGYFDGDGSVYMSKNSGKTKDGYKPYYYLQACMIGEEPFLREIGKILLENGITWTIKDSHTDHMKYLRIHGGHNLRKLHKYMYTDSTRSLQRKAEKWQALYTAPQGEESLVQTR